MAVCRQPVKEQRFQHQSPGKSRAGRNSETKDITLFVDNFYTKQSYISTDS